MKEYVIEIYDENGLYQASHVYGLEVAMYLYNGYKKLAQETKRSWTLALYGYDCITGQYLIETTTLNPKRVINR